MRVAKINQICYSSMVAVGTLLSLAVADLAIYVTYRDILIYWYGLSLYLFCYASIMLLLS